jgi:hypothetical protein
MTKRHKKPDASPLSGPLRKALAASGLPLLTLEQQTGVKRASIARFMRGEQSLRMDKGDALAAFFGLKLGEGKQAAKGTKANPAAKPRR